MIQHLVYVLTNVVLVDARRSFLILSIDAYAAGGLRRTDKINTFMRGLRVFLRLNCNLVALLVLFL